MKLTQVHPLQDIPPAHLLSHSRLNFCPFFQALFHPSVTVTVSLLLMSADSCAKCFSMFRNSTRVAKKTTSDGKVILGLEDDHNAGTQTGTSSLTTHAKDLRGVKMGTPVPARSKEQVPKLSSQRPDSSMKKLSCSWGVFRLASQSERWKDTV